MLNGLLSANMGLSQNEDFWHRPSGDIWQLFLPYNNLMLFAWAGFVFGNMNLCIWCQWKPFEHEWGRKGWESATQRVCFFLECVCVVIFGQNIKKHSRATRQLVLFASYLAQPRKRGVYTLAKKTKKKTSRRTHNTIAQMQQIIHPSFMPGCIKLRHPFVNCG